MIPESTGVNQELGSSDHRNRSLNFSAGEWKSSVVRGRLFSSRATSLKRRCGIREGSVVFGKYCRRSPIVFSSVPHYHRLCGSQKYTGMSVATVKA